MLLLNLSTKSRYLYNSKVRFTDFSKKARLVLLPPKSELDEQAKTARYSVPASEVLREQQQLLIADDGCLQQHQHQDQEEFLQLQQWVLVEICPQLQ